MPPSSEANTRALNDLITSTLSLIQQFNESLKLDTSSTLTSERIQDAPNPLHVLRDSAKLLKAHTTKLSLLAINKPFTPSAISKVLKELAGTCLPAMMSAVQICAQQKEVWGSLMAGEVQVLVRRVCREMEMLLGEIRSIAAGGSGGAEGRDSLSSTGVVWEACDALVKLEQLGVVGLAVRKAEQYRETIQDAINELREWKEGSDLDFEGRGDDVLADSDDEAVDGDKDSIEDIFNAANSMPKDRPELLALVEDAEAKLKKVAILYQALLKRRINTLKDVTEQVDEEGKSRVARLEAMMLHLKRIPFQVDELAGTFYELDEDGAKQRLHNAVVEAKAACEGMKLDWNDQEDSFTAWSKKWTDAIG